jgi:transcriptional regulator with XRE-family HTH domain
MNNYFSGPSEVARVVAERARERRIAANLRQADLAETAGVSLSKLRRFEQHSDADLETVVRIAFALGAEREFGTLFPKADMRTIEDILEADRPRRRVRR